MGEHKPRVGKKTQTNHEQPPACPCFPEEEKAGWSTTGSFKPVAIEWCSGLCAAGKWCLLAFVYMLLWHMSHTPTVLQTSYDNVITWHRWQTFRQTLHPAEPWNLLRNDLRCADVIFPIFQCDQTSVRCTWKTQVQIMKLLLHTLHFYTCLKTYSMFWSDRGICIILEYCF